jgi:hypothetical protein
MDCVQTLTRESDDSEWQAIEYYPSVQKETW